MAEIRTIEYTVTEQLTLTPTATQEAGVQGDDRATAVRFTLPTALTQGYRLQLMMEDGRGGVDVTDTLTVKGTDSKYVEYILPLSWTQHGGEIKVRLMAFIYSESGTVTQAAYSFEGRLRFRDKTTFVKKVGTHLEDTLVEVLAGIDDARNAATNAIAAAGSASASEIIATDKAAAAAASAASAADSKTTATNAATAAAGSKTAAQEAQTAAESAAATATAKATAAAGSATAANNSATSAAASAAAAESSAENAAASATAAEGAATNVFHALRVKKHGGTVRIDDAVPVQHQLALQVKSKNLVPQPYDFTTRTVGGVTFTANEDGTVTANGTATEDAYIRLCSGVPLQLHTQYTISGCPDGGGAETYTLYMTGADWHTGENYDNGGTNGGQFIPNKERPGGYDVCIVVYSGVVCNDLIFSPQIEEGATATAYTKGVEPSAVTVQRYGKNLIPYPYRYGTKTINGITFTVNEDRSITVNGTATATAIFQISEDDALSDLIGQTVALSGCPTGGSESTYRMRYQQTGISSDVGNGATFTVKKKSYLAIQVFAGTVCDNMVFKPQIEVGAAATAYEPYTPPTEYTPAADGTVTGVLTLDPVTTLTTDSAGAVLEAEYSRDVNKAFEELWQAIRSLGGTV